MFPVAESHRLKCVHGNWIDFQSDHSWDTSGFKSIGEGRGTNEERRPKIESRINTFNSNLNRTPAGQVQGERRCVHTAVYTLTPRLSFSKPGRRSRGHLGKAFRLEIRFPGNEVSSTDEAAKNSVRSTRETNPRGGQPPRPAG